MPLPSVKLVLVLLLFFISSHLVVAQAERSYHISGNLEIDETWEPIIYISHIPTFEEMYYMSNEMIIAKTEMDSLGYFEFDLDFLPKADNLYRLHIIKKGNPPATLIIGGKDENHLFLILNRFSKLELYSNSTYTPFKSVYFKNSAKNNSLQRISNMVNKSDSIGSLSSASKRLLINNQLQSELLSIADTSSNFLVGLYALYKSKIQSNHTSNLNFLNSFNDKWKSQNNSHYNIFKEQDPTQNKSGVIITTIFAVILFLLGFLLGKTNFNKNRKLKKLTIQERKVYDLLSSSLTNQEIANKLNIGINTVKSHVTSIYSKLKIKSRKEIVNRRKFL